jgi:hypothetical protein
MTRKRTAPCEKSCENSGFPHTKSQAEVVTALAAGANTTELTAKITGYSQRTVQRAVARLVADEACYFVVVHGRPGVRAYLRKSGGDKWKWLRARCKRVLGKSRYEWVLQQTRDGLKVR